MNQNQRKYALERINAIVREKVSAWRQENPEPQAGNPSNSRPSRRDMQVGGGWVNPGNSRIDVIADEVAEMRALVSGGLIAIDVESALQSLDRITINLEAVNQGIHGHSIPTFNLLDHIQLPENIYRMRVEARDARVRAHNDWEARLSAFTTPLEERASQLKDRVMLGSSAEALTALNEINNFEQGVGEPEA